jgi:hypothetical protein
LVQLKGKKGDLGSEIAFFFVGKATTADTPALADTRTLIKNPAHDTGSRPHSAGRLTSRRCNIWRLLLIAVSVLPTLQT